MFYNTDEHNMIKDAIRELYPEISLKNKQVSDILAFCNNGMKILIENGYNKMSMAEKYGGLELDFTTCIVILSEIAKVNSSLADLLSTNCFGFCNIVEKFGTEEQKLMYLPLIANENKIGVFIYNEPDASNWTTLKTIAVKQGEQYVLNGEKTMITNIRNADYGIVFAKTIDESSQIGFSFFIVDLKNTTGISFSAPEKTMGMEGLGIGSIFFDNCIIQESNRILKDGMGVLGETNQIFGVCNSAFVYGIASSAYEEALIHCKSHPIEGKIAINNDVVRTRIADMYAKLEIMENLLFNCAELVEQGMNVGVNYCSTVKYFVTEMAKEICDTSLQLHGGYGYLKDCFIEQLYRDVRVHTIIGGPSDAILARLGRKIANNELIRK